MSFIETNPLKNSTIMLLYSMRDEINLSPTYQRMGGIWTPEKRQLLIDSIINDYDIPKIYFHKLSKIRKKKLFKYAVIDGRQRLETIWRFMDGKFCISDQFEFQRDPKIELQGLSYNDIGQEYPKIKIAFDSFVLPIIGVETDDEELIEDMFSRLNEAVPLNAAEKRNAIGGDLVAAIRGLADHTFFTKSVKFSNKRYQHREVAARLLLIEKSLLVEDKLVDTKKVYLDGLAKDYRSGNKKKVAALASEVSSILTVMTNKFSAKDTLLSAQGNMVIYYLLFRWAILNRKLTSITRKKFLEFNRTLKSNRALAEDHYEIAEYDLLEYDRLTQQGTNDASNIKERVKVLGRHLGLGEVSY